jgi:hypothetical protein
MKEPNLEQYHLHNCGLSSDIPSPLHLASYTATANQAFYRDSAFNMTQAINFPTGNGLTYP